VVGEDVREILRRLVAVEDATDCATLAIHLGFVSQRRQIFQRQLWADMKSYVKRYSVTMEHLI